MAKSKIVVLNSYIKMNMGKLFFSFDDGNLYYSAETKNRKTNYIVLLLCPLLMIAFVLALNKNIESGYQTFGNISLNIALIIIGLFIIITVGKKAKRSNLEENLILFSNSTRLQLYPERYKSFFREGLFKMCINLPCEIAIIGMSVVSFYFFIEFSMLAFLFGGLAVFAFEVSMHVEGYDTLNVIFALNGIRKKAIQKTK